MGKCVRVVGVLAICLGCTAAFGEVVIDYEDLEEGLQGELTFTHQGVTYRDVNTVSGHFPDGETFEPAEEFRQNILVEDATLFYDEFPDYGSPANAMTLGLAYIEGPNLTIGPLASLWMDLDQLYNAASLDIGYYENGPWGGIEYHLDALLDDAVVASDSFVISDLGGRDNPTFGSLSLSGAAFDQLHLYAWYDGMYSKPRGIFDDLTLTPVPEPATMALVGLAGLVLTRRRR